jgi:flagellar hook protein FlgE
MGIFDALNTAVAGLQSQSFALQNISGNIANASTIGYKGIDTTFEDLVAQSAGPTSQVAGGVQAFSQQTLTTAGTVTASTVATNMAINGDGFFSVMKPTSTVDNQPVFNGVTDYTRAGDFQVRTTSSRRRPPAPFNTPPTCRPRPRPRRAPPRLPARSPPLAV